MFSCLKKWFCQKKKEKGLYVLQLTNDKYYIGESDDTKRRIWMHENNNGSAWTKKYQVLKEIKPIHQRNNLNELIETLEMMKEYGIENVRGSMFTKPFPLDSSEKIMAAQLYCELHNLCRKCGGSDHFIGDCIRKGSVEGWVNNFGGKLELHQEENRVCLECNKEISSLPSNFKYCRICFLQVNGYK